jgi:hypothetical protein
MHIRIDSMAQSRSSINLIEVHRVENLALGLVFPSIKAATYFLQDYSFNQDKSIRSIKGGGKRAQYRCDDDVCKWRTIVSRRHSSSGMKEFVVSALHDEHIDTCVSFARTTERQIPLLRTFLSAVTTNQKISRRNLTELIATRDQISIGAKRSAIYRAKDAVIGTTEKE